MLLMQSRVASGEDIFGPLLRKFFLNNNHRVTVELLPDSKLGSEKEQAEKERLKAYQAKLSSDDVEATIAKTKELRERQVGVYPLREACPHWTKRSGILSKIAASAAFFLHRS